MKYKLVSKVVPGFFEQEVNAALEEGYELLGELRVVQGKSQPRLIQAMAKYGTPADKGIRSIDREFLKDPIYGRNEKTPEEIKILQTTPEEC